MLPRVAQFPRGNYPDQDSPSNNSFILSLGGGTILRPENAALIKEHCKCFFLRASVDTLRLHLGGDQSHRPLLKDGGFEAMLAERTPAYTAAADYIIDMGPEGGRAGGTILTTGTPEEVAKSKKGYTPRFLKEALKAAR